MHSWIVDTFADDVYDGNPAAVIVEAGGFPPTASMQAIAASIALPTTAFVVPGEPGRYRIRWFTPEKEINLCGHATIASAGYLFQAGGASAPVRLCFQWAGGELIARREGASIVLSLPQLPASPCEPVAGLDEALGADIVYYARAADDILVGVESEDVVAALEPDFDRLRRFDCRGHIVTAPSCNATIDFVSRTFFPALGVNEDQVCVSAHCKLGPYWAERLQKQRLSAVQLSQRGGRLVLDVVDGRVDVAGTAIVRQALAVHVNA